VLAYNSSALPEATKVTLTGEGTALVPSAGYTTSYGYNPTGSLHDQQDPASGGLPAETINYGYDEFGQPTTVTGSGGVTWDYVAATGYSRPVEHVLPRKNRHGPYSSGAIQGRDVAYRQSNQRLLRNHAPAERAASAGTGPPSAVYHKRVILPAMIPDISSPITSTASPAHLAHPGGGHHRENIFVT
jgi:hypothetical protein